MDWKKRTLLIGIVVGAITGAIGAFVLIQAGEKTGNPPKLTAGDGVKVGVGLMAVLRLLTELGSR
ncbi:MULTISPECIES: hypothetical protein [Anaerolinea]|uniref:Uncharacterized protein n=1 Tax=Anaerolinea thermophila (strain DSM 14523 / JCM 11388 / NBRC 100420 / UNI-1) TaxID=926569 RepID=E8N5C5_ANATU|nr:MULTISPECIES: hypothetical protein [Anaerolinea]BAJ63639.1 hypothetical protein ANT_16130 [Anaerolinea thermophila UNI-1]